MESAKLYCGHAICPLKIKCAFTRLPTVTGVLFLGIMAQPDSGGSSCVSLSRADAVRLARLLPYLKSKIKQNQPPFPKKKQKP